ARVCVNGSAMTGDEQRKLKDTVTHLFSQLRST
ncbi:hypothetical protein AK812_SmicGene47433, partial [Symbiodinium microadriaticum]